MERWQQLTVILVFTLLLAAGLNYTGRSMHQAMGGDNKYYTFLFPDLKNHQVVFCGRSFTADQAENLWERRATVFNKLLPATHLTFLKQMIVGLKDRLAPVWSSPKTLLLNLWEKALSLQKEWLPLRLPSY
ncbi:MAG: hypothetical protein ABSC17_03630 [Thermacetogeniaceae bacterium]